MTSEPRLYQGVLVHHRLSPRRHRLRYRLFMILIDLDSVAETSLFSLERFNWLSWRARDHGDGSVTPLRQQIARRLVEAGICWDGASIALLTMPRVLGFVFNPLSLYLCRNADGALAALAYEVSNTFGERHYYLFQTMPNPSATQLLRHTSEKRFFVSPLLPMQLAYDFTLAPPSMKQHERDGLTLGIVVRDKGEPVMSARLEAQGHALTDANLLRAFFACPLMTIGVVLTIHWQALRLIVKGVPYLGRQSAQTLIRS